MMPGQTDRLPSGPGAWAELAAQSLVETFEGSFETAGVVVAAACVDEAGAVIRVSPAGTPADGRLEIGSVTKTMTATLLALLASDGTLRLDDEVGRFLAAGANGGITLRQLATHTSGLPRIAPNFDVRQADPVNPFAGFTAEQAEEGLREAVIAGHRHLYSNFGYQLLGLVLERAAGSGYPALLADRLLNPLGMTHSGAGRLGAGTFLPGHFRDREVGHRDHPVPGPGGVSVTIEDLARYAQACLHPPRTPLGAAITAAQAPQVRIGPSREQALAWVVVDGNRRGHGGGTAGFTSCLIIDPRPGRAVAVMASSHGRTLAPAALLALSGSDPRQALARSARPAIERFTGRAREAVRDSREQARERGHHEAAPGHLLLALCEQPQALAAQVLRTAGVDRSAVEQLAVADGGQPADGAGEHSTPVTSEVVFTPGAVDVLRQAGTEADNLGHRGIGTEHLLLALFQDAESPAASTLAAFGLTHEDTTAEIQQARTAAAAEASRRETSE
jgi:serine-type D-Ala-D-Ala carboxypeptidase/endopeptidase